MKEWLSYVSYKYYKLITIVLICVILNFLDCWLIDLFVLLFRSMAELRGLVATLVLTLVVSVILFITLFLFALRLKPRIFPSAPAKPGTAAVHTKATSEMHPESPAICRCASGTSRDMLGTVRFHLSYGEEALLSMNVVKREDGSGLLRSDCKVSGKVQSVAFRINFCPTCGGRFLVTEQPKVEVNKIVTRPALAESKDHIPKHLA